MTNEEKIKLLQKLINDYDSGEIEDGYVLINEFRSALAATSPAQPEAEKVADAALKDEGEAVGAISPRGFIWDMKRLDPDMVKDWVKLYTRPPATSEEGEMLAFIMGISYADAMSVFEWKSAANRETQLNAIRAAISAKGDGE